MHSFSSAIEHLLCAEIQVLDSRSSETKDLVPALRQIIG